MTSPPENHQTTISPKHWATLTSCFENFQVKLSDNPSKIGPNLDNGRIRLQDEGYCEITHQGNLNYHVKSYGMSIMLEGELLEKEQLVKIEAGNKIYFKDQNQNIHPFVFSSHYLEDLDEERLERRDLLTCPVCLEIFYKCYILMNCSHRFCEACLMKSLQEQQEMQKKLAQEQLQSPKHVQLCPYCKQTFNNFQKDLLINNACEKFVKRSPVDNLSEDEKRDRDDFPRCVRFDDINQNTYIGFWKGGKRHGEGKMIFKTGDVFKGQFYNDFMEDGIMTYQNGTLYQGTFRNNKKHGEGRETIYSNGVPIEYMGAFSEDKKHGQGILIFKGKTGSNIFFVQTEFLEGLPGNKGTILYQDGSRYHGDFCSDNFKRNGFGELEMSEKDVYKGNWEDDKMHGEGTIFYHNDDIYLGNWHEGDPQGRGRMVYSNGEKQFGYWVRGEFIESEETDFSDTSTNRAEDNEDLVEVQKLPDEFQ